MHHFAMIKLYADYKKLISMIMIHVKIKKKKIDKASSYKTNKKKAR